jgi:hypothetical protein
LVLDRNGDGVINDGRELFGSGTRLADGSRAMDGYAALGEQDTDKDGDVDANDAGFGQLKVWVDADKDGITDTGELKTLAELGITKLDVTAEKGTEINNGNLIGLTSGYTKSDGSTAAMADVWFAKDQTNKPTAADVLAPAQGSVPLPAATPGVDEPSTVKGGGAPPPLNPHEALMINPHRRLHDDDDSFKPPLI